ncbi:GntR family transcriptional regulator [Brassicibacter mesophilus]|uniref:GntR family transcriptional regulator n=1 Tax=Brassicibacter mesophilus TaxID=745119 RepID=UPI003D2245B6
MKTIDKHNRIPLYYQLMDIIIEEIETGNLKENDKLQSERELCNKYDISRATVRQAIQELEKERYIYKEHGKGTFVAPKTFNQDLLKFYSFTEEMKKLGKKPSSQVTNFQIVQCDEKLSRELNIDLDQLVYKFTRLRLADNVPMMIETTLVPYDRFPGIKKEDLEETPMYDIFTKKFNAVITKAEENFRAVQTREEEARLLNVNCDIPSLLIERITYEKDQIIEYTKSIARGDKFVYRAVLEK